MWTTFNIGVDIKLLVDKIIVLPEDSNPVLPDWGVLSRELKSD